MDVSVPVSRRSNQQTVVAFGCVSVIVGLLFLAGTLVCVQASQQVAQQRYAQADASRRAAEEQATALRDGAEALAESARAVLTRIDVSISKDDATAARAAIGQLDKQLAPTLALTPPPDPIAALNTELTVRRSYLAAWDAVARGDGLVKQGDVLAADDAYGEAATVLATLTDAFKRSATPKLTEAAVKARRAKIAKRVAAEQRRVAKEKAAEEEAAQQAALLEQLCGRKAPGTSAVSTYLRSVANDPSSVDLGDCSAPRLTDRCWRLECTFRGKNAFGALVLDSATFYLSTNADGAGGTSVVDVDQ